MWAVASAGRVVRGEVEGGDDEVEGGEDEVEEFGEVEVNGEVGEGKPELPG